MQALGEEDGLKGSGDIVDAVEHDPIAAGEGGDDRGSGIAMGNPVRGDDFRDEGLPGDTEEERAAKGREFAEIPDEGEIVPEGFSKADPGIVAEGLLRDAGGGKCGVSLEEPGAELGDDVPVVWILLHGARGAAHVHDDDATHGGGAEGGHGGVRGESGDVIYDIGAGGEGAASDGGFGGINGDEAVPFGADCLDDGGGAADFFRGIDRGGTGPA